MTTISKPVMPCFAPLMGWWWDAPSQPPTGPAKLGHSGILVRLDEPSGAGGEP
jgi:hypothetical protein